MIISYLFNKSEIEYMSLGFIVALDKLSFKMPKSFSVDEIKDIKNSTSKLVFLDLRPIYHEVDFDDLDNAIKELSNLDGFLFSDLGLYNLFKKYDVVDKAIYIPLTFNSTSYDIDFFYESGIHNLVLSSDLTKRRIDEILNSKDDSIYSYIGFGYPQIFYSYRKHFSNYDKYYKTNNNLKDSFDVTLKELTRNDFYHAIECDKGFRIFKDKLFNGIFDLDINRFKYVFLDRIFVNDELYFDTVKLYNNELPKEEYLSRYKLDLFDNSILFNEVGLLKEDSL